jgi:hypothetical protein
MHPDWMVPDWPAPANVRALMTTRAGGVSKPPYDNFNPAGHVDDEPAAVAENRRILRESLPAEPLWLNQVHGTRGVRIGSPPPHPSPPAGREKTPPPRAGEVGRGRKPSTAIDLPAVKSCRKPTPA